MQGERAFQEQPDLRHREEDDANLLATRKTAYLPQASLLVRRSA
jgi:hypothetical protein